MSDGRTVSTTALAEEDLEDLYENAPCGYLSITPDSRIAIANETFSRWLLYPKSELVGKQLHAFLSVASRIFYETHFAPLVRMQGFFNEVALELVRKDGSRLAVLVNATERRDPTGAPLFVRLTVFDATDRRRYESELLFARDQLRQLNAQLEERLAEEAARRERSDTRFETTRQESADMEQRLRLQQEQAELREQFIAVLGHDLRNPLSAISAGTAMLVLKTTDQQSLEILGLMQNSARRMAALIDNVLDFARGQLGDGLRLLRQPTALEPVLGQVVAELRAAAPQRLIITDFRIDQLVDCDSGRIAQLFSNLLSNALTHGDKSSPVRATAFTDQLALHISVANAGQPIPEASRKRLFQPFFRGEQRAPSEGLGLGLYIASEVAKAHGGTLNVISEPGVTTFTFRMALRQT